MKFLVVLAVIAVVFWLWNNNRKQLLRQRQEAAQAAQAPRVPQPMVRCAHCGLHLARQDALQQGAHWFCSPDHARAGAASTSGAGHHEA